jgi:anti-sigma regulatory factor (Ser/Thr protein kinase)
MNLASPCPVSPGRLVAAQSKLLACRITTERALLRPPAAVVVRLLQRRLRLHARFDADAVETALHEAIVNAAIHGNLALPPSPGQFSGLHPAPVPWSPGERAATVQARLASAVLARRPIDITAVCDTTQLRLAIRDRGSGFAVRHAPAPDPAYPTGRGLQLMRAMARQVTFARGGSEVRLIFDLIQPPGSL